MIITNVEHRNLADSLAESTGSEPVAVVIEEEAVERQHHVIRQRGGHFDLLVRLLDPSNKFGLFRERIAVYLESAACQPSSIEKGERECLCILDHPCG